jgi:hypothetical protein
VEPDLDTRPVIIRSSPNGLLVSHNLSRHNIDHIQIGGNRPPVQPRTGKSDPIFCDDVIHHTRYCFVQNPAAKVTFDLTADGFRQFKLAR